MLKLTYRQMKENIKKHLEESRPNRGEFDSNQSVFNFEGESPELLREAAEDAPSPYPIEGAEGDFHG